ncbi:MAG: cytochrome d ubiquinol oxidase subunit II [Desulfofustis sp. PB-SRB1]|nr:cytochrome d ubiquinol oxidase subunit II [Desulfofustis sp. PB-SRB1]
MVIIWFILLNVLLIGYAILDGFDLGVGILHPFVAKDDTERRLVMNSIGPLWDGNEVWLVTFGGALFAMFPGSLRLPSFPPSTCRSYCCCSHSFSGPFLWSSDPSGSALNGAHFGM